MVYILMHFNPVFKNQISHKTHIRLHVEGRHCACVCSASLSSYTAVISARMLLKKKTHLRHFRSASLLHLVPKCPAEHKSGVNMFAGPYESQTCIYLDT